MSDREIKWCCKKMRDCIHRTTRECEHGLDVGSRGHCENCGGEAPDICLYMCFKCGEFFIKEYSGCEYHPNCQLPVIRDDIKLHKKCNPFRQITFKILQIYRRYRL